LTCREECNTAHLPVILVGDLNANWSMPMYEKLSESLDDSRFKIELCRIDNAVPLRPLSSSDKMLLAAYPKNK